MRRILSLRSVCELTCLSRTTIWRLVRQGAFPQPVKLSPGRQGYLAEEIEAWIAARANERGGAA